MIKGNRRVTVRVPQELFRKIRELDNDKISPIIILALSQYVARVTPGFCQICYFENAPEAQFCSACGYPLSKDVETIFEQRLRKILSEEIQAAHTTKLIPLYELYMRRMARTELKDAIDQLIEGFKRLFI